MKVVKVTVRAQDEKVVERAQEIAASEYLPFSRLVIKLLAEYVHNTEKRES